MATPSELKPWLRTAALVYDEYHGGILGSKNDGAPLQLLRVAGMYPTDRAHMRRERTYFAQECWLVLSDRELIIWARLGEREIRTFDIGRCDATLHRSAADRSAGQRGSDLRTSSDAPSSPKPTRSRCSAPSSPPPPNRTTTSSPRPASSSKSTR